MEKISKYSFFILVSIILGGNNINFNIPTGENYITGEDGIKRIYVNVWGHVKYPGTYLVYEDIDIATLLSMAGGPLDGAKLSKIKIMSQDNSVKDINFENMSSASNSIKFKPYDTISIEPSLNFYIRDNAYILNVFLQLLTLGITLNNNN